MNTFTLHTVDMNTVDPTEGAPWTAEGGEPVRCCLRDARPGEALVLVNYRPHLPEGSPYQEIGAVFVHPEGCDGPKSVTEYPADWYGRSQVLRAYDDRGWIHPASRTHDGTDPVAALEEVLATPGVVEVHSRNIVYGCFMFAATR
jgi:Protein of unknown function (DUF1203)